MDARDETIRTVDGDITRLNNEITNYDPTNKRLWHPTEASITAMPSMANAVEACESLGRNIAEMAPELERVYSGITSADSTLQLGAQAIFEQTTQLSSFSDSVLPTAVDALKSGAVTCNNAFQYIRAANAQSREAIAQSTAHKQFGPIPYGDAQMDESKLTSNSDDINATIDEVEAATIALRDSFAAWNTDSSRNGWGDDKVGGGRAQGYGGGAEVPLPDITHPIDTYTPPIDTGPDPMPEVPVEVDPPADDGGDLLDTSFGDGPLVSEPELPTFDGGLSDLDSGSLFDDYATPEDISTQTSGWEPEEDNLDSLFEGLDDDFDDEAHSTLEELDPDFGGDSAEMSSGEDIADPEVPAGDDSDSGIFGDNLDGDLPPGGASEEGIAIAEPEMGEGGWLTDQIIGEEPTGVTTDINGEDIEFPNQPSADLAETLAGDGSQTLRDAAADAGFNVPPGGQDIGTAVDPVNLQPGDVVAASDGDYLYLGDEKAIGSDGEIREFGEDFPTFDDAHQGFFRMDAGEPGDLPDTTAGSEAPTNPDTTMVSSDDTAPTAGDAEPIERRDDAPVGLGAGQFSPDTDTVTTAAEAEPPVVEAQEASVETTTPDDAEEVVFPGANDPSASEGTSENEGDPEATAGEGTSLLDSDSTAMGAAGNTESTIVGGSVADGDAPVDADTITAY